MQSIGGPRGCLLGGLKVEWLTSAPLEMGLLIGYLGTLRSEMLTVKVPKTDMIKEMST